jgi:hypothetical protein
VIIQKVIVQKHQIARAETSSCTVVKQHATDSYFQLLALHAFTLALNVAQVVQ